MLQDQKSLQKRISGRGERERPLEKLDCAETTTRRVPSRGRRVGAMTRQGAATAKGELGVVASRRARRAAAGGSRAATAAAMAAAMWWRLEAERLGGGGGDEWIGWLDLDRDAGQAAAWPSSQPKPKPESAAAAKSSYLDRPYESSGLNQSTCQSRKIPDLSLPAGNPKPRLPFRHRRSPALLLHGDHDDLAVDLTFAQHTTLD